MVLLQLYTLVSEQKSIQNTKLRKIICTGMGRRTKIITEYRQTGGDADGDNIVGMGTKYFAVSSSDCDCDYED